MKVLKQKTMRKSDEIFNEIKEILLASKSKIQVVSAWFTDPQLLDVLIQKQKEGVSVSVIISDQKENKKLPFNNLSQVGGEVSQIKKTGYGMMHQKFCIVDDETLVHGSYNWTINARKNNDESVIITNHDQTIKEMSEIFNQLKQNSTIVKSRGKNIFKRLIDGFSKKTNANSELQALTTGEDSKENGTFSNLNRGYKIILDNLIESEISNFDKDQLRENGFEQGKLCDGNHETLENRLNSLYTAFLRDISLSENKLKALKTRIEIVRTNAISQKEQYKTIEKNSLESVYENKLNERLNELDRIKKEIESKLSNAESIEDQKNSFRQKIDGLKEKLHEIRLNFKPLVIKDYEYKGFGILSFISFVSIFLFYGSALYILLFSTDDAVLAMQNGIIPESPGIFDGGAFAKALSKGYMTLLLICSFFVVPVVLSLIMIYNKSSKSKMRYYLGLSGILVVDVLLATIVSKNVHDVQYLIGNVTESWSPQGMLYDVSFWSVFLVGSLVVLLFEFCLGKIKAYHDAKDGDIDDHKLRIEENQIKKQINTFELQLEQLSTDLIEIHSEVNQKKIDIESIEREIHQIPNEKERELKSIELLVTNEIDTIDENCDLVTAKLESGQLPYSFDSVLERISIFLNGWSDFLHSHYSNNVANEKTIEMNQEKDRWISNQSNGNTSSFKNVA